MGQYNSDIIGPLGGATATREGVARYARTECCSRRSIIDAEVCRVGA